jgi:small redox-active disulfide protein 2
MLIKILGAGCEKCERLEKYAGEVVSELGLDATVEEIRDARKIAVYHLPATPGLVINEELVCSGRDLTKRDVTQLIINALDKEERAQNRPIE